jgi:hypothetical protein
VTRACATFAHGSTSGFFHYGPEPFGADKYFFEMAIPNVPMMQGYEPYIEPGFGGTSGQPKMDGVKSIHNDWRQNKRGGRHRTREVAAGPTQFRTGHREHIGVD